MRGTLALVCLRMRLPQRLTASFALEGKLMLSALIVGFMCVENAGEEKM